MLPGACEQLLLTCLLGPAYQQVVEGAGGYGCSTDLQALGSCGGRTAAVSLACRLSPRAYRLSPPYRRCSNGRTRALSVDAITTLSVVGLDLMLGMVCCRYCLGNLRGLLFVCDLMSEGLSTHLLVGVRWIMGVPAGLKLNDHLDFCLGNLCIIGIECYQVIYRLVHPLLPVVMYGVAISGVLGLTVMVCVMSDLLSLATLHIRLFYSLAARWHGLHTKFLISLWRLFRGKKRNVLRRRIDACDYSVEQLVVGTLMFTVLVFLFPTTFVYYLLFFLVHSAVQAVQGAARVVVALLNYLPSHAMLLRLRDPSHLPGGVRLDLLPFPYPQLRNRLDSEQGACDSELPPPTQHAARLPPTQQAARQQAASELSLDEREEALCRLPLSSLPLQPLSRLPLQPLQPRTAPPVPAQSGGKGLGECVESGGIASGGIESGGIASGGIESGGIASGGIESGGMECVASPVLASPRCLGAIECIESGGLQSRCAIECIESGSIQSPTSLDLLPCRAPGGIESGGVESGASAARPRECREVRGERGLPWVSLLPPLSPLPHTYAHTHTNSLSLTHTVSVGDATTEGLGHAATTEGLGHAVKTPLGDAVTKVDELESAQVELAKVDQLDQRHSILMWQEEARESISLNSSRQCRRHSESMRDIRVDRDTPLGTLPTSRSFESLCMESLGDQVAGGSPDAHPHASATTHDQLGWRRVVRMRSVSKRSMSSLTTPTPSPLRANERRRSSLVGRSSYLKMTNRPLPFGALFVKHKARLKEWIKQNKPSVLLKRVLLAQPPSSEPLGDEAFTDDDDHTMVEFWLFFKARLFRLSSDE